MTSFHKPSLMKAIVLQEYNNNLGRVLRSLAVEEKELRDLNDDEILVKMDASPCNPSDIAFLRGMYNVIKPVPVVPGFEGTGTVVHSGHSSAAGNLLGKRVSCFSRDTGDGTWAEYFITKPSCCIQVRMDLPMEQAACLAVNPFTAAGLIEIAKNRQSKAIIQNGAAGQIGGFVRNLATDDGMPVINIVRSDQQVQALQEQGALYILNQKSEGFETRLKDLAYQLEATTGFDAVGGEMTGMLLNAMPAHSQVVLFGGLSGQSVANIDVLGVIFQDKSLTGFNLGDWINQTPAERFEKISADIQDNVINGKLLTKIQAAYSFDQVIRGLLQYAGHMSDGKVLFVP